MFIVFVVACIIVSCDLGLIRIFRTYCGDASNSERRRAVVLFISINTLELLALGGWWFSIENTAYARGLLALALFSVILLVAPVRD